MEEEDRGDCEALKTPVEISISGEVPIKSFILYEVEIGLKNLTTLLCTFSRTYIQ